MGTEMEIQNAFKTLASLIPGTKTVGGVPILPSNFQQSSTQAGLFGNQIPAQSGVLHEFVTNSLVPPELQMEARLCTKIINKNTGYEWDRDLSPAGHWDVAYAEAIKHPELFERVLEAESRRVVNFDGDFGKEMRPIYTIQDLKALAKHKLDEIGRMYNVRSNRKPDLIIKIINAQAELVAQVRYDQLQDGLVAPISGEHADSIDTDLTEEAKNLEESIHQSEPKKAGHSPEAPAKEPKVAAGGTTRRSFPGRNRL